jgi:opacity protein-like surface antigen
MKTSTLFSISLGSVLLLAPLFVSAQYPRFSMRDAGPYARFDIGPTFPEDGRLTAFGAFPAGNKVQYGTGFAIDAAVGYAFTKWVAAEMDFGWRWNEISHVEGFALRDTLFGHASFLANVVLQYPMPRTRMVPYIGGGVGGSATIFDTDGLSNGAVTVVGSDTDFVFAYQGFAGLRFAINAQMSVGAGYKYFASEGSSYRFESLFCCGPDLQLGFAGVSMHMATVNFMLRF